MDRKFTPCSGQGGKLANRKNDWAISLTNNDPPYWRALNKAGRLRTFKDYQSAERAALKMEPRRGVLED